MKYRMAAALLSLAGLFVSLYLYLYKLGKIGALVCGTGDCEKVQLSQWSRFIGIDVALIGVVGYVVMLGVTLAALQPALAHVRWPSTALVLLAGGGVAFAIYLTYVELFVIHAICRWCVASAVIVAAIFAAALLNLRSGARVRAAGPV